MLNQALIGKIYALCICLFVCSGTLAAQSGEPPFIDGDILVQARQGYDIQSLPKAMHARFGSELKMRVMKELSRDMRVWLVQYKPSGQDPFRVLEAVKNHESVAIAQLNHLVTHRATTPNDPSFAQQWQYINTGQNGGVIDADIDADDVWDITTGGLTPLGDTITICVIDDGLDQSHQDFGNNIWVNYNEIPNNNIDDDGNGFVDDRRGWNSSNSNDNIYVGGGHGTPVAGIMGAKGNNGIGVSGVNWDVKIMVVVGGGNEAQAIAAYAYPLALRKQWNQTNGQAGAFVVATNASWGVDYGQPSQAPLWCAIYDSLGKYGVLNCGATINNNTNVDQDGDLPTACPSDYLISVTNMDRTDTKVQSAGYGATTIDLGAFGKDTYTAAIGNSYGGFGGTSGATPHVTGAIGLLNAAPCQDFALLSRTMPDSAARLMKRFILDGVDANTSLAGITVTGGRLNLYKSMLEMLSWGCSGGGCSQAYGLGTSNVIDTSATLSWGAVAAADSFTVQIRPVGTSAWSTYGDTTGGLIVSNLQACTDYEFRVEVVCDSAIASFSPISVFTTDGCCSPPTTTSVSNIQANAADINFSNVLAAVTYNLQYRKTGTTTWTTLSGLTATTVNLTGLDSCTMYEYALQTVCDTGATAYGALQNFETVGCVGCRQPYCTTAGDDSSDEWLESVTIHTLSNTSGDDGGYGDYTASSFTTTLQRTGTYNLALTPGFNGYVFDEYFRMWLDVNQDGDFDDAGELVYDAGGLSSTTVNATFTVPANAVLGTSRIRVAMRYNTAADPCGPNFDYGEVEDYCVQIGNLPLSRDVSGQDEAKVFPNPFQDQLNIQLTTSYTGEGGLTLFNTLGEVVRQHKAILQSGVQRLSLSTSGLAEGIYFLNLRYGGEEKHFKVTLIHQ